MKSLDHIKPTTIAGIKRLAKSIKKRDNITHAKALEAAAKQAGFANYQYAFRSLRGNTT